MKKITFLLIFLFSIISNAQTPYQNGMKKAFGLWQENKTDEASRLFERIANAEKTNWLPYFYVAQLEVITSFGLKDENLLVTKLTKAQEYINVAKNLSKNNPEIIITQAMLHTAYIAFDGQKYGMTLSAKNSQLYAEALAIAPENPRVVLSNAEWNMGAARFFGKNTKPYCDDIKKAIELSKTEVIEIEFYPKFFVSRAEKILEQCKN